VVGEDYKDVSVDGLAYRLGEEVSVFSVLSQESFRGALCSISDKEIAIRTCAGPCLVFTMSQLQLGRVYIETKHN